MRVVSALATFVAATVLACVVAYWGWHLFGPSAVRIAPPEPTNAAATIIAANLFGSDTPNSPSAASSGAVLGNDTRLLGIIAEQGHAGYALFRGANGPKLVARGQEIASGITLVAIDASAVTIRDGAGEHRLMLRAEGAGAERSASRTSSAARSSTVPATRRTVAAVCSPPAGFRGAVVKLNTELMSGVGAESVQWNRLLAPINGGLVVREDNGFGAMLGLKVGDVITQANGIALSVPEDVTTAVVRPLTANQGVRLIGARNGVTQELWLANVACAG
jgi:hypothetical protein